VVYELLSPDVEVPTAEADPAPPEQRAPPLAA